MDPWTPNLSWIEPDLAVGGSFPVERAASLARDHGIGAVVDLREEACDDVAALDACGLRFLHLPTPDMLGVGQPMLDEAVAFAREAREGGLRLLIHCEHGIGRSATTALCVLVDRGWAPLEALQLAKDRRALISPSRDQFEAWAAWLGRRGGAEPPSYHAFGIIAYRHLAQPA
jgi:predicted protein tyrosine phosphatase